MALTQTQVLGLAHRAADGRQLGIYLRDHLITTYLGVLLARRVLSSNRGNAVGGLLEALVPALERDRAALQEVARALNVREGRLPRLGVWFVEKLGRLKLNGRILGYSPLSRVVELEALMMLAAQRYAMWQTLERRARVDRRLDQSELRECALASGEQRGLIEQQLLAASLEVV